MNNRRYTKSERELLFAIKFTLVMMVTALLMFLSTIFLIFRSPGCNEKITRLEQENRDLQNSIIDLVDTMLEEGDEYFLPNRKGHRE